MDKLEKYRKKIDMVDDGILKMLNRRMLIVKRIGRYKRENNIEIVDEKRWGKVMKKIKKLAEKQDLDLDMVESIWNEIHKAAIELEKKKNRKK